MDPLTISVSILTVLAAVDRLVVLFPNCRQYFQAREGIEALQTELQHLRIILVAASEASANSRQPVLEAVLGDCLGVLQSLENDMSAFGVMPCAPESPRRPLGRRRRMAWLAARSRILESRQRLRDSIATMTLALLIQNITICSPPQLEHVDRFEVSIVQSNPAGTPDESAANTHTRYTRDTSLGSIFQDASSPPENLAVGAGEEAEESDTKVIQDHVARISTEEYHRNSTSSWGAESSGSWSEKSHAHQRSCAVGCSCRCHDQLTKAFDLLGGFLGKAWFTKRAGSFPERNCTEPSCRGSASVCRIIWYSPRWLSRRGLALSFAGGGRILTAIAFPRILPPDHKLFIAIRKGNISHVRHLLAMGQASVADIMAPYGHTAIGLAILYRQIEIGEMLLDMGAGSVEPPGWSISDVLDFFMSWSAINSAMDAGTVVRDLARIYDRQKDQDGKTVPIEARMDASSFSALHKCVLGMSRQSVGDVARISRAAVNETDASGRTALHWAVKTGKHAAVQELLQCGAEPDLRDKDGMTPLHVSASLGFAKCAKHLIRGGASLEAGERFGATPLHVAASSGSLSVIRELADAGANVNALNTLGETPALHANWSGGKQQSLELLVRKGAMLDQPDAWGYTELSDAVHTNSHRTIPFLLRASRKTHCRLVDGRTILHVAARNGDLATVELLLDDCHLLNVEPQAVDKAGATALDYVRRRKDAKLLLEPFCSLLLHVGEARRG